MGFSETGRWVLASLLLLIPLLIAGWFACRKRILEAAEARRGHTGDLPVVAGSFSQGGHRS
ncbi:L-asparagine permease 1 [Arthrobacter sp. Hiyo8]|nr:L-asparagine permease 1 [Arthrobacter sp. Hiyo8]